MTVRIVANYFFEWFINSSLSWGQPNILNSICSKWIVESYYLLKWAMGRPNMHCLLSVSWRTDRVPRCLKHTDNIPEVSFRSCQRKSVLLTLRQVTMATEVRQELAQLMNSSGSHKDLAAKYVSTHRNRLLANSGHMLFQMKLTAAATVRFQRDCFYLW